MKKETLAKLEKAGIRLDGKKVVVAKGPALAPLDEEIDKITDDIQACIGGTFSSQKSRLLAILKKAIKTVEDIKENN